MIEALWQLDFKEHGAEGEMAYKGALQKCSVQEIRTQWANWVGSTEQVVAIGGFSGELGQGLVEMVGRNKTGRCHLGVCPIKDLDPKAKKWMQEYLPAVCTREGVWIGDEKNQELLVAFNADRFPRSGLNGERRYVNLWNAVLQWTGAGTFPLYHTCAEPPTDASQPDVVDQLRHTLTVVMDAHGVPAHVWSQVSLLPGGKETHCVIIIIVVVVIIQIFFFHPVRDDADSRISYDGQRRTLSQISSKRGSKRHSVVWSRMRVLVQLW